MRKWLGKILSLMVVVWVILGQAAFGGETAATEFPDRLKIWGGYQYLFGLDANIRLDGSRSGFGTSVNWEDDLDGDTTDSMIRAGIRWRFNPKHAIGFSYYDMDFDGTGKLDQNFQIDDTIFQVGARTDSELDLALFRFFYTYSFYRSDKVELSLSPGIYLADFDAKIKGTLTIEPGDSPASSRSRTVKESEWAPSAHGGLCGGL